MFRRLATISLATIILGSSGCLGVFFYIAKQPWVDFSVLEQHGTGSPTILLDDEGKEWARFQFDKRDTLHYKDIPKVIIDAFIAAEDWNFFKHPGVSLKGIARSILVNLTSLRKAQGASTITQQLVRLLYFENEKSFKRKFKEQVLSLIVERQFTKEQILEIYLNHVYLGGGIYGVEAACQRFWSKPCASITPDEAATLASIIKSPKQYCPLYNVQANKNRRNLILKNMLSLGLITKDQYTTAIAKTVVVHAKDQSIAPHLKETIRVMLEEMLGKDKLYRGGLIIHTTLNRSMQETAEQIFSEHLKSLRKKLKIDLDGGFICIEGNTGAIKALVGGYDYALSQWNRALQARRQMGSTFKCLLFAHALMLGRSFTESEVDEPIQLTANNQEWSPGNANNQFLGPMSLAQALATSNNIIAIKTYLKGNPEQLVSLARTCGLQIAQPYPSLALGCVDVTLPEAISFINIFAHQGLYVKPYMLTSIKDQWGTKIWKESSEKKFVLPSTVSSQVGKVLMRRIEQAKKANPEKWFPCDALGKTGTTNDARTCWFVGSTPSYTTGIYLGHDDNRAVGDTVLGAQTAFPIWREFNKKIKNDITRFTFDQSLQEISINALTGAYCAPNDPEAISILVPAIQP